MWDFTFQGLGTQVYAMYKLGGYAVLAKTASEIETRDHVNVLY